MAAEQSSVEAFKRLALQLQSLSEVTEALTYRLLELDERLASSELMVQSLQAQGGSGLNLAEDTELRLDDTEARLARLESMLSADPAAMAPQLYVVDERDNSAEADAEPEPVFLDDMTDPDVVPGMEDQAHSGDAMDHDMSDHMTGDTDGYHHGQQELIA